MDRRIETEIRTTATPEEVWTAWSVWRRGSQ